MAHRTEHEMEEIRLEQDDKIRDLSERLAGPERLIAKIQKERVIAREK